MDIPNANAEKETTSSPTALDVGVTLREARERMGLSVHDVAERIKFAPRQVEALEANDFAHLPQATFLRGFVRSYARMLQLDEAVLLAALPVDVPKQTEVKVSAVGVPFPAMQLLQQVNKVNRVWLGGALGVAILLGVFVWLSGEAPKQALLVETVQLPLSPNEAAASSAVAVNDEPPLEAAKEIEPAPIPSKAVETKKAATQKKAPLPEKVVEVAPLPETLPAAVPAATAKPAIPLEVLKRRPMHFVFDKDTWVEVKDVNGVVLLSRVNQRGSEQWIGGPRRAPYAVSISGPGNVKLYYKGKEIDLSAYAGQEVAHLKVE